MERITKKSESTTLLAHGDGLSSQRGNHNISGRNRDLTVVVDVDPVMFQVRWCTPNGHTESFRNVSLQ